MIIEFQRAFTPEEMGSDTCGICGHDFIQESVIAAVSSDGRDGMGRACPQCIEYFGWRNPKQFPTIQLYDELRREYPEPLWATLEECNEALAAAKPEKEATVYCAAQLYLVGR